MSLEPTFEEQELLADKLRRAEAAMGRSERVIEAAFAGGFIVAVALLWHLHPPRAFAVWPAGCALLILALAARVEIDTPLGFTVPTQLAYVPLVFVLPVALAPLGVAVALVLARVPDVVARRMLPRRLVLALGNSWFALGPAIVFAAANVEPEAAGAGLLLAALAAQFFVDFAASTLRFSAGWSAGLASQLSDAWVYVMDLALTGVALVVAEQIATNPLAALAPLPLLGVLAVLARERRQRLESLLELNNAYRGTALALGEVVEADDGYTGRHSRSVVALALDVGRHLELDPDRQRNLEFGALLHDVGKVAIAKEIINKPDELDAEEWTVIRTHTVEGQRMLERVGGFMCAVGRIVRSHHERWDGTGYPDRLAREAIPLEARIIACCDSWNAMRTDRPYRRALSHEAALAELRAHAGRQFDPDIVDALIAVVEPAAELRDQVLRADPASAARPALSG